MLTTFYIVWPSLQSSQVLVMTVVITSGLQALETAMENGMKVQLLWYGLHVAFLTLCAALCSCESLTDVQSSLSTTFLKARLSPSSGASL